MILDFRSGDVGSTPADRIETFFHMGGNGKNSNKISTHFDLSLITDTCIEVSLIIINGLTSNITNDLC